VCREYHAYEQEVWPFPVYKVKERPDPLLLSLKLYEKFPLVDDLLVTQHDIGLILSSEAERIQPDIIILMIVDGLSYYDLPEEPEVRPCIVNGVSITGFGYREVVGRPSVSQRLFSMGYRRQLGFTYYDTDVNPLAGDIYGVFGGSQVLRIRKFEDIITNIDAEVMHRGFIQIAASGLDEICHHHHDEPPVGQYITAIFDRFHVLLSHLAKGGRSVLACLTADHGILWREQLENQFEVIGDLHPDDARHLRYIKGSRLRTYTQIKSCLGDTYSLLQVPYITRPLKNNEWGVHGGISAWESIVPLIMRTA